MDVARMNFSHGEHADHKASYDRVRAASDITGRAVGVLADLQGPKIRLGRFAAGPTYWADGDTVRITVAECDGTHGRVSTTYKRLAADAAVGDRVLIDDGKVGLVVDGIDGDDVICTVTEGGPVSNNKGISLPGMNVSAPALSNKDVEDLTFALGLGVDLVALSFVRSPSDVDLVREVMDRAGRRVPVIAKLEKPEAVDNLEAIVQAFDGIMVARGDLAVEVGNAAVPALQKRMIKMAREFDKVVITATQMMESMISNPVPTRAEVSDVANAVLDGTDAVMLSAETAAGKFPLETVVEMAKICHAAEDNEEFRLEADFTGKTFSRIDQSIAMGALFTAHHLGAKAIVALTDSGSTALWMSRHLIHVPIYALTSKVATQRRMTLYRNVRPLFMDTSADRDTALAEVENNLKTRGLVQTGDVYAITCGEPMGAPGGTNMLKICRVG